MWSCFNRSNVAIMPSIAFMAPAHLSNANYIHTIHVHHTKLQSYIHVRHTWTLHSFVHMPTHMQRTTQHNRDGKFARAGASVRTYMPLQHHKSPHTDTPINGSSSFSSRTQQHSDNNAERTSFGLACGCTSVRALTAPFSA